MDATCCPMCKAIGHHTRTSRGRIPGQFCREVRAGRHARDLARMRGSRFTFSSCLSCGHVWASLEPGKLRNFIRWRGDELVRQSLDFLEHGPGHDLPDVPEARIAALGCGRDRRFGTRGHYPAATQQAPRAGRRHLG